MDEMVLCPYCDEMVYKSVLNDCPSKPKVDSVLGPMMFRVLKDLLHREWLKEETYRAVHKDFWDWVADEYPDTYDVLLSLSNNQLA